MIGSLIAVINEEDEKQFIIDVYEKYKLLMFVTARKYVKEKEEVEDVVQEALVKLISNMSTLRKIQHSKIEAYIAVTVKNTAISYCRQKNKECQYITFHDIQIDNFGSVGCERVVEKKLEATEQLKLFYKCLKNLSDRDQDVLSRKYYMMQSDEEIAKLHGVKPGSIRMLLTRIRRRILSEMEKEGEMSEII